ncbi:alpha-D-ribose 1-methylphosphonate 5-triphosphate diphosphatase [Mycolicibacterium sp. S2-37]|nr:alpha-D-ribose 1-methylphosphonate 5-triphosphate diphosphatase [Mycolicibacterium sp. S2-37]
MANGREQRGWWITVNGGRIDTVGPHRPDLVPIVDLGPVDVIPGCIDLHADSFEPLARQHGLSRGVALFQNCCSAAGITSAYACVAVESHHQRYRRPVHAPAALAALRRGASQVDLRTHLRVDVTGDGLDVVLEAIGAEVVDLVSLMDHTPGQGQFRTSEQWRRYRIQQGDDEGVVEALLHRLQTGTHNAPEVRARIIEGAHRAGIPVLYHDAEDARSVAAGAVQGIDAFEFPVHIDAAVQARNCGIPVAMGAENALAGRSRYGNLRTVDALEAGCLDLLVSDHSPESMIPAAYALAGQGHMPWVHAIALITANPASVARLTDRGRIAPGQRADLVAVRAAENEVEIIQSWVAGMATI